MFAFTQDVPISWEVYQQIRAELPAQAPPGLVVHLVVETAQGLRYVDVWESREAHATFMEQTIHPIVNRILPKALGRRPPEPVTTPLALREAWTGATLV